MMRKTQFRVISFVTVLLLLLFTGTVFADHLINRTPEIQGLVTGTSANVQGTVTEADSGAWTTRDNLYYDVFGYDDGDYSTGPGALSDPLWGDQTLDTTGYNDNLAAVSGQTTFAKSMGINTGNQIGDGSNVRAVSDLQFIAIDTGRATRSEDILIDGAGNFTNPTDIYVLCPFVSSDNPDYFGIPAHCNIAQAGSSIDTTLSSVTTSADDRVVGTESGFPVVLNYNINAQGIALGDQSSPMIGSVSAFLKVHTQEARQPDLTTDDHIVFQNSMKIKAEDLVYSETSSASGLIDGFSKAMHYQSGLNLI